MMEILHSILLNSNNAEDDGNHDGWPPLLKVLAGTWLAVELLFYVVFHRLFVPLANQHRQPHPYRPPYHLSKHQLLAKIVHRIRQDVTDDEQLREVVATYLKSWFRPKPKKPSSAGRVIATELRKSTAVAPSLTQKAVSTVPGVIPVTKRGSTMTSGSSSVSCSDLHETGSVSSLTSSTDEYIGEDNGDAVISSESDMKAPRIGSSASSWTIPGICAAEMDAFLAWALWGKSVASLTVEDHAELQRCYDLLHSELDLVFEHGNDDDDDETTSHQQLEPRLLCLDPMNALHRPLVTYIVMHLLQTIVPGLMLWPAGFQRVQSKSTGLKGWYRPGRGAAETQPMPLLFFHGIAPGGLCFYIPMVLWGLLRGDYDRACFLFENPNIAGTLDFTALTEQETVAGVQEIVDAHLPDPTMPLVACGHSFGSCQLTWLISSPEFRQRIRQFILLDPVTVLLSDPDVMANFLYGSDVSKIRILASSELFTEYYLRRHFAWYNSELWLDEMFGDGGQNRDDTYVVIALSEVDEIVNAPKVKKHLELFQERHGNEKLSNIYWKGAKHAACVTKPGMWHDIRASMLQNELEIAQQKRRN